MRCASADFLFGFHRLFAAYLAVSDVKVLASRLASYLPGNLLHLQAYLGLLKIVQMPPVKVDRNYVSKLLHGLTPVVMTP
jgi:hypothetical protein